MSAPSELTLQLYNGRELTDKEIILLKFFEERDREHQRKLEMKQRKRLSSVDDFLQDSGRAAPLKASKKTPLDSSISERDKFVQAELLQHKKKGLMAPPPASVPASATPMDLDDSVVPSVTPTSGAADVGSGDVKKPGKSTYHISSRQKQPVHQPDADEPPSSETPSATSSLIGKRTRDPSSDLVDDIPPVEVPPDELDPSKFPPYNLLLRTDWSPLLACAEEETEASLRQREEAGDEAREFILPDFSLLKNQTLAFKITVPADSQRWAINIGPADPSGELLDEVGGGAAVSQSVEPCDYWQEILFHFNPRYARRKEVVQAVMQGGAWTFSVRENNMNKMKDSFPSSNKTFTLIIQIRPDGFYTSVNGIFLSVFPHRADITRFKHLRLQLPLTDDSGNAENAIFHKVWWGRRDASNNRDFLGCNRAAIDASFQKTAEQARNIYIGGIPHTENIDKLDDLRAFILDIFDEFGAEPESLEVPPGKGFARLKLSSVEGAEEAIASYNGFQVENEHDPNDEFTLIVAPARS